METNQGQVDLIREAFHYQSRFDGSTMVFKIDFPVTESPLFMPLVKDLALLAQTGFRVVVAPGAREQIDAVLEEYGIEAQYRDGARITTAQAMPFVEMAAFHTASRFLTAFSASRVDAIVGNFVRARGLGVRGGLDMEHSGAVERIHIDSIRRGLDLGAVPILPCIGWSQAGKPYNVPSDEIALQAAASLGAIKLFIVSLSGGVTREKYALPDGVETGECGRVTRLTPAEAAKVLEMNPQSGLDAAKALPLEEISLAVKAVIAGVERIHIIDGAVEGSVLRELFSNLGSGTMVYADEYESIRALESGDITDVLRLMEPLMQKGNLVRRTQEDIQEKMADYAVFEIDDHIHACGALHDWGEGQAEIAAIATDPVYSAKGLGSKIVRFLIDKARRQGLRRVFVLTTTTHDWFEALGFKEAPVESLPTKKRAKYNYERKSKIYALDIE